MRSAQKLTLAAGTLIAVPTATGLAARDRTGSHAPMMDRHSHGTMPMMSRTMETCDGMMQAHSAQHRQSQNQQ